ncbi:MAG: PEP-CTERM sorting domain-containing protein [Okeania sp. SIO2F4]|uniref:PEP-CTERM sorting domain-containing protein n=1 Tax=Okeania sp. SIO2F4 TaxID=2607790 RepID=UPI001429DFCB|nr:PEP-CTERM sorting domain-containing protein [Okeania sp. SIO2F4]NES07690.1 PEP-CTERM sorting domain-containing protein [Okeania sp. SIO2F4]
MKNLKTNTQQSARNLFTSCLCGLSSAVLASSFALFAPAPEAAVAATLYDSDGDGIIEGVKDLAVGDSVYDVEFGVDFGSNVYSEGFDFTSSESARSAAESLSAFLESKSALASLFTNPMVEVFIGYEMFSENMLNFFTGEEEKVEFVNTIIIGAAGGGARISGSPVAYDARIPLLYARFHPAVAASTPEPSLILGFITLSGLMLGSKRKTKG